MQTALFVNFSSEPFTCSWDNSPKTFKPGETVFMPDFLAAHFAKHLTNRELIRDGLDTCTSPKKPADVPEYMNRFNKAYIPDDKKSDSDKSELDTQIDILNKPKPETLSSNIDVQVIEVEDNEDEEDGEADVPTETAPSTKKDRTPEEQAKINERMAKMRAARSK
jgi:hypothetical protein